MKQEEQDLLIKDLCARLPYGVKISIPELWTNEEKVETLNEIFKGNNDLYRVNSKGMLIKYIKPYLFPLSSMTKEQEQELEELGLGYYATYQDIDDDGYLWDEKIFQMIPCTETDDWINANHFDYRGLIEKSLALDATGKNIY